MGVSSSIKVASEDIVWVLQAGLAEYVMRSNCGLTTYTNRVNLYETRPMRTGEVKHKFGDLLSAS